MKQSIFFYKRLTPAEVGETGTHEVYIRMPNNFDYQAFFCCSGEMNGTVLEVKFTALDITNGGNESISLRFVYFKNSNQEKRIPSLGPLFKSHNVQEGDIVCIESKSDNNNISYTICFYKKGEIQISPDTICFSKPEHLETHNKFEHHPEMPLQQIYYGAPGTGKSHTIKETTDKQPKENVFRTTFHPDSDYSTFVGCYKPTMAVKPVRNVAGDVVMKEGKEVSESTITYSFTPQSFSKAYIRAWQTEEPVYLVIEEINRGNCAQIFGDLFQLLDRGDNGYSEYPIKADNDLAQYLAEQFSNNSREDIPENVKSGDELVLPSNLYIWATMNTSDQSLFPIDSAFKRRWDWEYEPIKYKNTDWVIEIGGSQYSWTSFQKEVNNKIFETTNSEDKMLGDYFVNPRDGIISKELLLNKILFYLWNDVCKDGDGDIFKTDEDKDVKFSDLYGDNGTNLLLSMMRHLKVSLLSGSADTADGEEVSDETAKQQGKSTLISIQLPNNPKILSANSTQFDAFVEALRVIGTDKIISVLPSLEYKRLGCPVISSQKEEGIINNNNNRYSYHQEDNLFIIKGCKNYTYIRILEDLNELLNIGLSLETK